MAGGGPVTLANGTVCGGGGVVETPKAAPATQTPVSSPAPAQGGGTPDMVPATEVSGGGGPELPFTGLSLWYAVYAGLALMLIGGGIWGLTRMAAKQG